MIVFKVDRRTEQANAAGFEIREKIAGNHVTAVALPEETERASEMQIDDPSALQARYPFLNLGIVVQGAWRSRFPANVATVVTSPSLVILRIARLPKSAT